MDAKIFLFLWDISRKNKIIRNASAFISMASRPVYFAVYFGAAAYGIAAALFDRVFYIKYLVIPFAAMVVSFILRGVIKRPRPKMSLDIEPLIKTGDNHSCPSNHAASAAVISAACMTMSAPLGAILFTFTFITGTARVFTGAHYPADVAAGWALGILFGAAFLL